MTYRSEGASLQRIFIHSISSSSLNALAVLSLILFGFTEPITGELTPLALVLLLLFTFCASVEVTVGLVPKLPVELGPEEEFN